MNPNPARLLIADEDQAARRFLSDNLAADGYAVATAGSATAAAVLLSQDPVDLVLVDVNGDTLALLDRVRYGELDRVALDLPMFVLTSTSAEPHRIRLFERGADECKASPTATWSCASGSRRCCAAADARARIASESGASSSIQSTMTCGSTEPLHVPKTEFALLSLLAAAATQTFTRAQLITELWGACALSINSRALDSHARRLRARLSDAGAGEDLIRGVRGVGYRYRGVIEIA